MNPNRRNMLKKIGIALAGVGLTEFNLFASSKKDFSNKKSTDFSHQFTKNLDNMKVGAFSISLSVKDINASKQFYENLGFTVFGGGLQKNYLIMKNGNALIGLFQGMFTNNILTFNPGWDENAQKVEAFDDIRKIQQTLKEKGVKFETEADPMSSGPASFIILDPDGNSVLFDQHI
jgi:catechol 2,3-dioxygenase-like lactoylglutathione lyase family enzyme